MNAIQFVGVDFEGDHVFRIPPTPALYFDECGGTMDQAVWCFVPSWDHAFIKSMPDWYEPTITYPNPEMGADLSAMETAIATWITEGHEKYGRTR